MKIETQILSRGITRLVHFTPFSNLFSIFEQGCVVPKRELLAHAQTLATQGEDFLLDYITFNDPARWDGREDCINLSIQNPNTALLNRFRNRFPDIKYWYILFLDPMLCTQDGVVFTTGNAASSIIKSEGSGTGEAAFDHLFAPVVATGNATTGRQTRIRPEKLDPCFPTDPQAEVLHPCSIPLDKILTIAAETPEAIRQITSALQANGCRNPVHSFSLQPELFH